MRGGAELIPRPGQNPAALKAALAVVAGDRPPEMIDGQTRAMAEAVGTGSVQPLRSFVAHRAAVVEIERRPATAQAYHRANYLANHAETVAECRKHATAVAELHRAAYAAVAGCLRPACSFGLIAPRSSPTAQPWTSDRSYWFGLG